MRMYVLQDPLDQRGDFEIVEAPSAAFAAGMAESNEKDYWGTLAEWRRQGGAVARDLDGSLYIPHP